MQRDTITELVQIPGFSVGLINFNATRSSTASCIRGSKTASNEKKGAPPEVRISLTRDKPIYCCSGCGQNYWTYYDAQPYQARDLPYGKWKKAYLLFEKVRVDCSRCGVKVEKLDWINPWARLTKRFEEEVARECRIIQSIKAIAQRFHMGWDTIKDIDKKYLEQELNPPDFRDVKRLAIDEIALRKGHNYATVISEAQRCRVLWVVKGRKEKSLNQFWRLLGKKGCRQIEAAVIDMWPAYEASIRKYCPKAEIVYDQFHIIQNYGKVIDKVRNSELAKAHQTQQGLFKGTKYLLLSNRAKVRGKRRVRLDDLLKANQSLSAVYILKDDLKHLWDYRYKKPARVWFEGWYQRARESGIGPLMKFADSLKEHLNGILAHCRYPLNTSFLEGMNNKIKVIKRIAFGFRDMDYFFLKIRGAFKG